MSYILISVFYIFMKYKNYVIYDNKNLKEIKFIEII